ncbi:hypothetical protein AA313_de0202703 [Arthrobotrys entomopaga]|nr:hypothetical protein AA313_de0202703 [Arthrobotrys entomopaga]
MGPPKVGQFFGTVKKKVEEAGSTIKLNGEKAKKSAQDIGGGVERLFHTLRDDTTLKQNECKHLLGGAMQNFGGILAKTGKGLQIHQMHRDVTEISSDEESSGGEEDGDRDSVEILDWTNSTGSSNVFAFELETPGEAQTHFALPFSQSQDYQRETDIELFNNFTTISMSDGDEFGELSTSEEVVNTLGLGYGMDEHFVRGVELLGNPIYELAVPLPELPGDESAQPNDETSSPQVMDDGQMEKDSVEPLSPKDFDWEAVHPFLSDVDEIYIPDDDDPLLNRRFLDAAWAALEKLHNATKREFASPQLKNFVEYQLGGIKGLANIISTGINALKSIFDGLVPSELSDIYCFLHVAYAISRSKKDARMDELPSLAFRKDLQLFRRCLSSISNIPNEPSQRDIFDEIVGVMWTEFQQGLEWASSRLPTVLSGDFHNLNTLTGFRDIICSPTNVYQQSGQCLQTLIPSISLIPGVPTFSILPNLNIEWPVPTLKDISATTIFQELIVGLRNFGMGKFFYLCLSSKSASMVYWMEQEPIRWGNSNCGLCGDPFAKFSGCDDYAKQAESTSTDDIATFFSLFDRIVEAVLNLRNCAESDGVDALSSSTMSPPSAVSFLLPTSASSSESSSNYAPSRPGPIRSGRRYSPPAPGGGIYCTVPGCGAGPFKRKQSYKRHFKSKHDPNSENILIFCPYPGCKGRRSTVRAKDNMRQHLKMVHPEGWEHWLPFF